ncbi:MAG: GNAT family N-acetyltransferase [Desulfotignum sp.]|jgi:predicted GNAT family acetyltransferase|nr:GNAT family N-acetyltransferase [Desulfotignum sp.]
MTQTVRHDKDRQTFFIEKDFTRAYLAYEQKSDTVLDFRSTFVPEIFRGQGIAADLVKTGLEYAKQNHFTVIPTCSYVDVYIKRHQGAYGTLLAR